MCLCVKVSARFELRCMCVHAASSVCLSLAYISVCVCYGALGAETGGGMFTVCESFGGLIRSVTRF